MRYFNLVMRFAGNLGCIMMEGWQRLKNREILFRIFLFILIVPNLLLCFTEPLPLAAKVCNVLLPFGVYYMALTLSRNYGRTFLWLFPILFFGAFQIVLLYLFGQSIIAVDMFLNLVTTNSGEALELLDNLTPAIVFVILLYVPTLIFAIISVVKKQRLSPVFLSRERKRAIVTLIIGLLSLGIALLLDKHYTPATDLYPVNVCYNIALAFQRDAKTRDYYTTSNNFSFHAKATHPVGKREVYVVVVGETARAHNWELYGYARSTNPELMKTKGLTVFSDVFTESNTTHKSVPMLLSSVTALDFDSIYYRKSIITAFKEAGFRTAFFSNQRYNHSFIDFFGKEADTCMFIKEDVAITDRIVYDDELLKLVEDKLRAGDQKLFIVLHTYGSHFNYQERYPPEMSFFRPDSPMDANAKNRNNLLNAYDNTIRYTDYFLARLIRILDKQQADAALIYTSDHGEDIFDDGSRLFLHASPVPTTHQLHIPFLVWMSAEYRSSYPEHQKTICKNRSKRISSSASLFQTMLDLSGIKTPYRNDTLSLASPLFEEKPRVYLDDHNKAR